MAKKTRDDDDDDVNHPSHYNQGDIETIEFVDQTCLGYPGDEASSIGEAIKYVARAPFKGKKIKDLKKARWYLDHAIELAEGKVDNNR
jgi:Protein of unknwon function (DUF3310)